MVAKRFEIWLAILDPTVGREMQKTRPCIVISPDEMNRNLSVVIAAPLTSAIKPFPFRHAITFKRKNGQIALDQLRTLDNLWLVKKLGKVSDADAETICNLLTEMFSY